jgi:hypothetical protein
MPSRSDSHGWARWGTRLLGDRSTGREMRVFEMRGRDPPGKGVNINDEHSEPLRETRVGLTNLTNSGLPATIDSWPRS